MGTEKIIGFLPIHYGAEYLEACLLSIRDHVDKMHVAYSRNSSHSFRTKEPCPDNELEIYAICQKVLADKLIWTAEDRYANEGTHRNERYKFSKGYEIIISIDADEVFEGIPAAINYVEAHNERYFGITGYLNFWRSFDFVNRDGFAPIRIERVNAPNQLQNLSCPLTVYHFSTCQRVDTIRYKNKVFGHASEIRPRWLEDVYLAWTPESRTKVLHPVSLQIWGDAESFDKNTLPEILKQHPNFLKPLIWNNKQ